MTILEQLDCGSSNSAVRKTRGSKRSKDSKYRSSLPRKIEQPDIFSDDTLFDTVDATNISKSTHLVNTNQQFQPLMKEQIVPSETIGNESGINLTTTATGSPDKV